MNTAGVIPIHPVDDFKERSRGILNDPAKLSAI